ncbi:unnamed protein product [Clonostachys rosea]|uniref:D-isomer specific 2-hydroxyacid dehydrogenase NAD-binding domain-containing protein n=1 Tax=Bionectria ochroleuca TaxID=29856 RepID=A0ABY6UAH8_BIOOC|nr:unnamed protein product [Clonostachys rosea]
MGDVIVPKKLPDDSHHVIVKLETIHVPAASVDTSPFSHEFISYKFTPKEDIALVKERVKYASIIATTTVPINAETLGEAPYLKCVITETAGTNHIDVEECQRRGVPVYWAPTGAADAVSEHALGLYFAARRSFVSLHNALYDYGPSHANNWKTNGSLSSVIKDRNGQPPRSSKNEVVGIFGYGPIGQRINNLCKALGMKVIVAGRKGSTSHDDPTRIPFTEVVGQATVLFNILPLLPETHGTFGPAEFQQMRPDAIIINVGRGGTIDEAALFEALSEGRIHGAATDVFENEPAGSAEDSILLSEEAKRLNLTLTPHLAWCADQTSINLQQSLKDNVREYIEKQVASST